jgi:hypothetical protein
VSFEESADGWIVHVVNDTLEPLAGEIRVREEDVTGTIGAWTGAQATVEANSAEPVLEIAAADLDGLDHAFLVAEFETEAGVVCSAPFFHRLWQGIEWPEPGVRVRDHGTVQEPGGEYCLTLEIETDAFARCLNLQPIPDVQVYFSDNYFDLRAGTSCRVEVRSTTRLGLEDLVVHHWLTTWDTP